MNQIRSLRFMIPALLMLGLVLSSGCATVAEVGVATGVITPEQGETLSRTFQDFTPENEYYLGRAVGATILQRYPAYENEAASRYVRLVGQACAAASDMPTTFRGYSFLILDSDEINAFAAPGGFIFVTRGMLRLCRSEDELAAVLAHEVAHVQLRHGVNAISGARKLEALSLLAEVGIRRFGSDEAVQTLDQLNKLTEIFGGSVADVVNTLVLKGYSREQEYEADRVAATILDRLGYDPSALTRVLQRMDQQVVRGGPGFGSTHPPASERAQEVSKRIVPRRLPAEAARTKRFEEAMRGI
ncbi:MAG: M48 family metalloprotease [Kiritimatiellae bacterium]|nr:M48 family metalloprotease [Kiritimatiellia bacterium]MDW8459161.1 M48 family metalloprotease [Verrucomicrobiota bacterium]